MESIHGPIGGDRLVASAVLTGPEPNPTEGRHDGSVLLSAGEQTVLDSIRNGTLHPLDRVVPMEGAPGEERWLILAYRPTPGASILIVDDNDQVLTFYKEVLEGAGYVVRTAESGAEALVLLDQMPVDLALVDVRLPDANGFELCRTIRSLPGSAPGGVLVMSADPTFADTDRLHSVGALGFLSKPATPTDIVVTTARAISATSEASSMALPSLRSSDREEQPPTLRFLGNAQISLDGRDESIPAGRSIDLLATLAAACPMSVNSSQLARHAWHPTNPASSGAVHAAVSRLRSYLASIGAEHVVVTDGQGYALDLPPENVDLVDFERKANDLLAPGAEFEIGQICDTLEPWRPIVFQSSSSVLLDAWAQRLKETRARLADRLALEQLLVGRAEEASSTAESLLADEPWRETTWAYMVIAQYRAGRTTDALQTLRTARSELTTHFGLEPGPKLAELEVMILTHDPALLSDEMLRAD